eukprot:1755683-Rhodomonas_salina.1
MAVLTQRGRAVLLSVLTGRLYQRAGPASTSDRRLLASTARAHYPRRRGATSLLRHVWYSSSAYLVLTRDMLLRTRCAMAGICYASTSQCRVLIRVMVLRNVQYRYRLRCYGMSGTDTGYGPTAGAVRGRT